MTVERTIKIIAPDGETVIGELSMQDGGNAAKIDIPKDWLTPESLEDIATACLRMVALIRSGGAE